MNQRLLDRIEGFLSLFLREELIEEIMGDLYEYQDEISDRSKFIQSGLLIFHTTQFLRPSLAKSLTVQSQFNQLGMLKLNFTISLRQFSKQKVITINSLSLLIISTLCFQLIYAWLSNEWNRDQFHSKLDRIHITAVKTNPTADLTSISLSTMFRIDYAQFPEIEQSMQVHVYGKNDAKLSTEAYDHWGKAIVADSNFFEFFDFKSLKGDVTSVLLDPSNIVVTEDFAKQLYGDVNPMGKTVTLSCDQQGQYQIGAVLQSLPATSSISFDFIVPRHSQPFWRRIPQELVLTSPTLNRSEFNKKIKVMGRENNTRFPESELSITPLSEVYLEQNVTTSLYSNYGNESDLKTLSFMALILLSIGWLGFNHLQSTTLFSQHKRLSIQQVMGSTKKMLWQEIVTSRILLMMTSLIVTFGVYQLIFNGFASQLGLRLDPQPLQTVVNIAVITGLIVGGSLLMARWQLSRVKVSETLAKKQSILKVPRWQKGFSVIQLTMSISLLIISEIVVIQYKHMNEAELGYHQEDVLAVDFFEMGRNQTEEQQEKARNAMLYLRDQLSSNPIIRSYSQSDFPIGSSINATSWKRANYNSEYTTENMMIVDPSFIEVLDLKMVKGRFFNADMDDNNQQKVVINQAAARYWNIDDLINARLQSNTSGRREFEFEILGVIKDYHYDHLSQDIKPLVLRYRPYDDDHYLIRIQDGKMAEAVAFLEGLYNEINPKGIFNYRVLDEETKAQYQEEERLGMISTGFSLAALVLSLLCLFTISVHETQRRVKEIGIRKVLGASITNIFRLQSLSFLKMVLFAFLIAIPIAYLFEIKWLSNYAAQVDIKWWLYASAGLLASLLVLLATGWQTWKSAIGNPVESLRSE